MDSVVVDGVTLLVYPSAADHGRWAIAPQGRDFGALTVVVDALIRGMRKGWIEAFHERQSIHLEHMSAFFAPKHMLDDWKNLLRWSSFGGSEDEEDFYVLTIEMDAPDTLIPTKALLSIIALLLERSGLDPTRTPEPLGTFDPNAAYAKLPYPPETPPPPPPPLNENRQLMARIDNSISRLESQQKEDAAAAHSTRVTLLNEMKEIGFFREDQIGSHHAGIAKADHLSTLLWNVEALRKYYASAHRKSALGTTSIPNVLGGPLSYQLIDQTRGWDFGDHHPHEIFAQLESIMRKQSNLEGDYGERKVEDGTFKATFHWEREDGIHASLTKVIVESW